MPVAAMEASAATSNADKASCKTHVLLIFEDIDHKYLDDLVERHFANPDSIIETILDQQDNGCLYPRRANPLKRKRDDNEKEKDEETRDSNIDIKAKIDDPRYLDQMRSAEYKDMATVLISQDFPLVPKTTIRSRLLYDNQSSVFRAYIAMDNATRNWDEALPMWVEKKKPTKLLEQYSAAKICDLDRDRFTADQLAALDEFLAARLIRAERDAEKAEEMVEQANLERARKNGDMGECGCCCDEFPLNRMVHCEGATVHWFCRQCMKQQAETTIGYSKHEISCLSMDGCPAGFSAAQKDTFLDKKLQVALNRIEAQAALEAAGIENLETCPFCPMAMEYPPVEVNKEFRCTNPSCETVSCRLCRKTTHIPKTCAEAAAEESHSARHTIEEAMSEAIIRKCNKCANPYIKTDGCNKICCTRCSTLQCYVCRKTVKDYSHFNDRARGGKDGQCPLFDQTEERHQDEVRRAEEASRSQVIQDHPELNGDVLELKVSIRVEEDERKRKERGVRPIPPARGVRGHGPPPDLPLGLIPIHGEGPVDRRRDRFAAQLNELRQHHDEIRQRYDVIARRQAQQVADRAVHAQRNAERIARFQAQQADAHRYAAQQIEENLQRQFQVPQPAPAPVPNIIQRHRMQIASVARTMPPQRIRGSPGAGQNAANPIFLDNALPQLDAQVHRNFQGGNVFLPLMMEAGLDELGLNGDFQPLQQLFNNGLGQQPNFGAPLGAINMVQDPMHQNIRSPPLGMMGRMPGSIAPAGQVRARPATQPNRAPAPASRVRDARA